MRMGIGILMCLCQVVKSSSREIVKSSSCQKSSRPKSSRQVVKSSSCQDVKLSMFSIVAVFHMDVFFSYGEGCCGGKFRRYVDGDLDGDLDLCLCQVVTSSSREIVNSASCQVDKSSRRQVVELSNRQVVKSSSDRCFQPWQLFM